MTVEGEGATTSSRLEEALAQRLEVVAPTLIECTDTPARSLPAELLGRLAMSVAANPALDRVWRLVVAVTGAYPDPTQVQLVRRRLRLSPRSDVLTTLLDALLEAGITRYDLGRRAELVDGGVVVDVDFCATQHLHNTGIQRVVRQTMRRWAATRPITLAAWSRRDGGLRTLTPAERSRVVAWGDHQRETAEDQSDCPLLVPYRSVVVLPEVARQSLCSPLEAVAALSGNAVVMIAYDCIPISSADTVPPMESERFTRYLAVVKAASVVAGISETAATEFQGFAHAVAAQGVPGPRVISVVLPVDTPDVTTRAETEPGPHTETPLLVLVVGSHEPRKNHDAIVFAAEKLWNEGLRFQLRFIGGGSLHMTRRFDRKAHALTKQGRPIEVWRSATDADLLESYRHAWFTMFPSLHEGFGLPVAESLALGVPVITSNYGSTAEIAQDGGCLIVDPRDDDAITSAMRRLLMDDELHARLVAECYERPSRTWSDYADALWERAVHPLTAGPL